MFAIGVIGLLVLKQMIANQHQVYLSRIKETIYSLFSHKHVGNLLALMLLLEWILIINLSQITGDILDRK